MNKMKALADLLHENYAQFGYQIPTKLFGNYCAAWMAGLFLADVRLLLPIWGLDWEVQNQKSRDVLGIEYPDLDQCILAMTESLIEHEVIPDKRNAE